MSNKVKITFQDAEGKEQTAEIEGSWDGKSLHLKRARDLFNLLPPGGSTFKILGPFEPQKEQTFNFNINVDPGIFEAGDVIDIHGNII